MNQVQAETKYTVEDVRGCKIIRGTITLRDMACILGSVPEGFVLDTDIARRIGANSVMGLPEDLKKLTDLPMCEEARLELERAAEAGLSKEEINWLATGERGNSSEVMFSTLTGFVICEGTQHPLDVSDFNRCRKLLKQVPALRDKIGRMARVSSAWWALYEHWDELERLMDAEVDWINGDRSGAAPTTYQRMRELLESA